MTLTPLSGLRDTRAWFSNTTNLQRTLYTLQILTAEFTQSAYGNTVQTIELVNEPFPYTSADLDFLKSYYTQGYATVLAANQQSQIVVALDDGYQGLDAWDGFHDSAELSKCRYGHAYLHNVGFFTVCSCLRHRFSNETLSLGYNEMLNWFCSQEDYIARSNQDHWTIVGEWTRESCALKR